MSLRACAAVLFVISAGVAQARAARGDPEFVTVTVVDPQGHPVDGASVSFGAHGAETGASGMARLYSKDLRRDIEQIRRGNQEGELRFAAWKRGFATAPSVTPDLSKPLPEQLKLTLRPGWTLRGQVHDEAGKPLARANVLLMFGPCDVAWPLGADGQRFELEADPNGRFQFDGLEACAYDVLAWTGGEHSRQRAKAQVQPGAAPITMTIVRAPPPEDGERRK